MVGLKLKDVNKDVLMLFILCYEYPMSFTNVYKLFNISKKYFWTFMEICAPMLKMGVRKATMMRKSVDRILPYVTGEGEKKELTAREENILEMFSWFFEDSFSDGEGCLHINQLEQVPFAKGYTNKDLCVATTFEGLKNNLDQIAYVDIAGTKFYKTSRFVFYMEKYCGDLDIYQINNFSVKEMLYKIDEGERRLAEKEYEERAATISQ